MARTGFGLGGPGAITTRPADADQVVSGSTWAQDNIGSPLDATWVNRVRANLEAMVIGLGGSLSDGDAQLINALTIALALKAPIASPALTGTPTAPTAAPGTNTTQLATTAYVIAVRDALLNAAPGVLDTLDELAAALGDDANFAATVTAALSGKQPLDADLTEIAALTRAKGALIAGGASAWGLLSVGSDGQVLTADATQTFGVKWAAAGSASADALADGTESAPAVAFASDPDTGIYRIGSDKLAFAVGGTRVAFFEAGRLNVGVSTNAGAALHIASTGSDVSAFCDRYAGSAGLIYRRANGTQASPTVLTTGDVIGTVQFRGYDGSAFVSVTNVRSTVVSVSGSTIKTDLQLYVSNAGVAAEAVRVEETGVLRPAADNTQSLGSASYRWSTVYAGTGTINTSDATQKTVRGSLTAQELAAWARVSWKVFQWNDAIASKGMNAARFHAGLIAQDVRDAFSAEGLDAARYGLFCADVEMETYIVAEPEDEPPVTGTRPTDRIRLGLRYDQCLAFEAAYQRSRIAALEARLAALEG